MCMGTWSRSWWREMTGVNIQHRTSNIQQPMPGRTRTHWMLGVGCWVLDVSSVPAFFIAGCQLTTPFSLSAAAPTPEQTEFFEQEIRPVFAEHCYSCHSAQAEKVKGGLRLDTREALLKGGSSGPVIVPGDANA